MSKIFALVLFSTMSLFANEKLINKTKECNADKMFSCIDLGVMYFTGDGVEINLKKSEVLFRKVCKRRVAQGCYYLGYIYKRGGKGVVKDKLKAKLAFGRACNIGSEKSCVQFRNLEAKGI